MITLKYRNSMPPAVTRELDQMVARLNVLLSAVVNPDGSVVEVATPTASDIGIAVGSIMAFGGSTAPSGWLMCDGSAVSRSAYATLFGVVGTTYGTGDGSTTFNIPDLRQRFPLGKAAAGTGSTLGSTGGAIDHVHSGPSHTHTVTSDAGAATGAPSATTVVQSGAGTIVASSTHTHTTAAHDHGGVTGAAGAGNTGTANPPYQVVNYIILAQ